MKVYITKYALSEGIFEADGEICEDISNNMFKTNIGGLFHNHPTGTDEWHRTKESAIKAAEYMRLKKIDSLKKQIRRLEKLKFD